MNKKFILLRRPQIGLKGTPDLGHLLKMCAPSLMEVEVQGKRTKFKADFKAKVALEALKG